MLLPAMEILSVLSVMTWADWLTLLLPSGLMFALAWWRTRRARAAGQTPKGWRQLAWWPGKARYLGNLLGFTLASLLTISLTIMVYRNLVTAQMFIQPAASAVEKPDGFPFDLSPVAFASDSDVVLRGWLIEPELPATVILLHGYGGNRSAMLWHAEQLAEAGFGVLLYDERGSGQSGGSQRSYGWQDPHDVIAALNFLQENPGTSSTAFGIAGCSIGGQIALQAAARDDRLQAVWADGPAIVRAADLPAPHNGLSLLNSLSSHMLDWFMAAKLRMRPPPALIDQLPQLAGRPVQLVSGGRAINALGPESWLTTRFLEPAGPHAELWVIEQAVHCDGPSVTPLTYRSRLLRFFQMALLE